MGWLLLILYLIGAVTAYPRNKKWFIENILDDKASDWTNQDMVEAIFACLFMWYIVWACFIFEKIGNIDWFTKKAKF